MKKLILLLPLLAFVVITSCSQKEEAEDPEPQSQEQQSLNPNGDSELALLMRQMFDVGMDMKAHVEQGKVPEADLPYQTILTAEPTDTKFTDDPDFPALAQSYIDAMKNFQNATPENAHLIYTSMVNTCMSCHRSMCPGPVVKIKKLYLEES